MAVVAMTMRTIISLLNISGTKIGLAERKKNVNKRVSKPKKKRLNGLLNVRRNKKPNAIKNI